MLVRSILKIIKISNWNIGCLWHNLYYNFFCKSVKRTKNAYMFIYPHTIMSVDKKASIELHGSLYLGIKSIKGNRQTSKFLMKPHAKFVVNNLCEILDSFDIQVHSNGNFSIDSFHSNVCLEVSCGKQISIIGNVMAGRHVRLKDYNGHWVSYEKYPFSSPIIIEDHVWLCTGSTINPGVKIGSGSVIGDNANVIADVPPGAFVQGNPAEVVFSNVEWSK
ncbi:transferase hexapeptide (six repeat-containing protein) [Fibrobacter sp. UWCM]|nr:transferase hexapeptide (six repeat-containing protein) [Fibrobacter sp. UWCM]